MDSLVFHRRPDRDCSVVPGEAHTASLSGDVYLIHGDTLVRAGQFPETGKERTAFNEELATRSIEENSCYRFHCKTVDPVAEPPSSMP